MMYFEFSALSSTHLSLLTNMFRSIKRFASVSPQETLQRIISSPTQYLSDATVRLDRGATKFVKKVGRGDRNGKGKTSGRGMKGYQARSSKAVPVPGFEGGQTGILKAPPKFGAPLK
jgi:large subunit ribosomal protein L15